MRVQYERSGAPSLFKASRHFRDNNDDNNNNTMYRVDLLYALPVPVPSSQTKRKLILNE